MSNQSRVTHSMYRLLPMEIEGFDSLAELALDLRWSWNHATDKCGGNLIPHCGPSRIPPGSSCRRSRATRSSADWPTPFSANALTSPHEKRGGIGQRFITQIYTAVAHGTELVKVTACRKILRGRDMLNTQVRSESLLGHVLATECMKLAVG